MVSRVAGFIAVFVLTLLFVASGVVYASTEGESVQVHVFGPTMSNEGVSTPYTSYMSSKIVQRIMEEADLTYEIVSLPWVRAVETLKATPNSLIFNMARTQEREGQFLWIHQHQEEYYQLIGLDGIGDQVTSLADVREKGYRVQCSGGTASCDALQDAGLEPDTRVRVGRNHIASLVGLLVRGRADFMLSNMALVQAHLIALGEDPGRASYAFDVKKPVPVYLAANSDLDPEICARILDAIDRIRERGDPLTNIDMFQKNQASAAQ